MDELDILSLFGMEQHHIPIIENTDICCGKKMKLNETRSYLICKICNNMIQYFEELFQKPESQNTQFDDNGRAHYGQNTLKTNDDRIKNLSNELTNVRAKNHLIDNATKVAICRLMLQITNQNTKKKDNRNQLYAACTFLCAIENGYIVFIRDLVEIFNLNKSGIKDGLNMIIKHTIINNINLTLDPTLYKVAISKYLKNVSGLNKKFLLGDIHNNENEEFCIRLVEHMLENSIAYDTKIFTKASASVYYLLKKKNLYKGSKKLLSSAMGGVGQNTTTTAFNILLSPEVQALLPKNMRMA